MRREDRSPYSGALLVVEKPKNQIIWLASYPRSGNTWMRFLLANLIFSKPETSLDIEKLIPDIHFFISEPELKLEDLLEWKILVCKTHFKFNKTMPLVQHTGGFIYIVRHPIDVMMSNFNYNLRRTGYRLSDINPDTVNNYLEVYINDFLKNKGDSRYFKFGFGNILEHYDSWLKILDRFQGYVIRYEDLLSKPKIKLQEICNFLGLNVDSIEIERAIQNSSFSEMKKLEEQAIERKELGMLYHPSFQAAHKKGVRFFNRGKAGWGKEALSNEQIERAKDVFSPILNRFKYE
ncbi:sulfotransferase domain-containing protein [Geitlerinema sp. CS-897]|nr:sulfotransferase domain-containing protein [Geitlerinema sp. CS-897]